ncbi:hypothetical protein STRTUCAR8_00485, partial [Streptomyces turgidiscabies Car8]
MHGASCWLPKAGPVGAHGRTCSRNREWRCVYGS